MGKGAIGALEKGHVVVFKGKVQSHCTDGRKTVQCSAVKRTALWSNA